MLQTVLYSTLLIALDHTHPDCLSLRFQLLSMVHSRPEWLTLSVMLSRHTQANRGYAMKWPSDHVCEYTSGYASHHPASCTGWHAPIQVDHILPGKLSWCPEEYFWVHSHVHSELHLMTQSQPAGVYTPEYAFKMLSSTLQVCSQIQLQVCYQWHFQSYFLGCFQLHLALDCTLPTEC